MALAKKNIKKRKSKPAKASMAERFPMNIKPTLFAAWQDMKRKGDPALIMKELRLSRPIIDRALKYGHVKHDITTERISKFFHKRLEAEKDDPTPPLSKSSKKLVEAISK